MSGFEAVKWVHLLAAGVWTGGLIVLGALVTAVRRSSNDIEVLRSMARMFGRISWIALVLAVLTGTWMYTDIGLPWKDFSTKGTLVLVAAALALAHQLTAKRTSPAVRGMLQGVILIVSIGIFGAAVALVPGP